VSYKYSTIEPQSTLPSWLHDLISSPPQHGQGVHTWLFRVARQMHHHRSEEDIVSLLRAATQDCGRPLPDRELREAVRDARQCAWQPGRPPKAPTIRPRWSERDDARRGCVIEEIGMGLADLWEESPIRLDEGAPGVEELIDILFPAECLLCAGLAPDDFDTLPREEWRGYLHQFSLVVPSPMTACRGTTKSGTESARCNANTSARRFLVVEFDDGTLDEHAALLAHLAGHAPLILVVHSGNKSMHGWFWCGDSSEDQWRRFMDYAVMLGADPATWTRSQMVRLPWGMRSPGVVQKPFYLNPDLIS
jgi:hypothetical protein